MELSASAPAFKARGPEEIGALALFCSEVASEVENPDGDFADYDLDGFTASRQDILETVPAEFASGDVDIRDHIGDLILEVYDVFTVLDKSWGGKLSVADIYAEFGESGIVDLVMGEAGHGIWFGHEDDQKAFLATHAVTYETSHRLEGAAYDEAWTALTEYVRKNFGGGEDDSAEPTPDPVNPDAKVLVHAKAVPDVTETINGHEYVVKFLKQNYTGGSIYYVFERFLGPTGDFDKRVGVFAINPQSDRTYSCICSPVDASGEIEVKSTNNLGSFDTEEDAFAEALHEIDILIHREPEVEAKADKPYGHDIFAEGSDVFERAAIALREDLSGTYATAHGDYVVKMSDREYDGRAFYNVYRPGSNKDRIAWVIIAMRMPPGLVNLDQSPDQDLYEAKFFYADNGTIKERYLEDPGSWMRDGYATPKDALTEAVLLLDSVLNKDNEIRAAAGTFSTTDQGDGTPQGWKTENKTGMDSEESQKHGIQKEESKILLERDPKRVQKKVKTTYRDTNVPLNRDFLGKGYEHGGDPKEYPVGQEGWWSQSTKDFYYAPNEPSTSFAGGLTAVSEKERIAHFHKLLKRGNPEDLRFLAQAPDTPEDIFEALAERGNADILERLARNDDVPTDVLKTAAVRALTLGADGEDVLRAMLYNSNADASVRDVIAGGIDRYDSLSYKFVDTMGGEAIDSEKTLLKLASSKNHHTRTRLATVNNLPDSVYHTLYESGDPAIIASLARSEGAPRWLVDSLLSYQGSAEQDIRIGLSINPTTPVDVLTNLFMNSDNPEVLERLARNTSLPVEVISRRFATNPIKDKEILFGLVRNNNRTPSDVIDYAVRNAGKSKGFYESAAIHPNLSPKTAEFLYAKDRDLAGKLAMNENTPAKVLAAIYAEAIKLGGENTDDGFELINHLSDNPNTPPKYLAAMLKSGFSGIRDNVAGNPGTPEAVLRELATTSHTTRKAVYRNPKCPADLKKEIRQDLLKITDQPTEDINPDVNKPIPKDVKSGDQLYKTLLMRQELLYKYRTLKEQYAGKTPPPDSRLPVLEFEAKRVQDVCIDYIYKIIFDWRRTRLGDRANRIVEMERNESILEKLKAAKGTSIDAQAEAIELGLNTIHSSGQMIEHLGLSVVQLDHLSDMDTTKWDKQLEFMAFKSGERTQENRVIKTPNGSYKAVIIYIVFEDTDAEGNPVPRYVYVSAHDFEGLYADSRATATITHRFSPGTVSNAVYEPAFMLSLADKDNVLIPVHPSEHAQFVTAEDAVEESLAEISTWYERALDTIAQSKI